MTDDAGNLHNERKDYVRGQLQRDTLIENPLAMFGEWMQNAIDASIVDATAMTLATVGQNQMPSARIVLLKKYSDDGFYWYTNYESRKGQELADNPNAALLFFWRELERQVRIEGLVSKISAPESDEYFNSRPVGSRFSAAASPQSQVIENQQWLSARTQTLQDQHKDNNLPRPITWGGYKLEPTVYEFWQGRPSRQHDRFRYKKDSANSWLIDRLAP